MPVTPGYRAFAIEQLERVVPVTSRNMFGGVGIYHEGLFFALIDDDRLYFKVDDTNRPEYEEAGMEPFQPFGEERPMNYYEVPIEVLEDTDRLKGWIAKAVEVARRKGRSKKRSQRPDIDSR